MYRMSYAYMCMHVCMMCIYIYVCAKNMSQVCVFILIHMYTNMQDDLSPFMDRNAVSKKQGYAALGDEIARWVQG